jgi:hypothetical protein
MLRRQEKNEERSGTTVEFFDAAPRHFPRNPKGTRWFFRSGSLRGACGRPVHRAPRACPTEKTTSRRGHVLNVNRP